ncbi:hypothetical protein HN953_00315 [Candidatus Woesearchaeota archaeon]|jgi:uncharacterized membrane protein|nr:hypothetical protein [Candidatus Woesearchaeota archaeon]
MSNKKLGLVLLFLFILPIAFASDSYTFYSGAELDSVCPRSTGLYSDVIENDGDVLLDFSVSSSGSAAAFATTVPTGFTLYPGEIKNIYTYVTPMSSVGVGNYVLQIDANANGISKSISHNIAVGDCYEYSFDVLDTQKSICPCEDEKFGFQVTNLGEYLENYELSVEGAHSGDVVLSQNTLSLTPGETKVIYAYVQSSCESEAGDYEFSVTVDPVSGTSVKSQVALLTIDGCYNFDVATERDLINICEHSSESVAISVENSGTTSNVFDLELDGPLWANLERNRLEISAGSSGSVNLELVPDYGVEGSFQITFGATPEKGTVKAVNVFDVNVKKCYDVSVTLEKSEDKICNALENTYTVLVRNQGEFEKEFFVDVDGPSWVSVDETSVSLGAGEEKQLTLSVFPQYDTPAAVYDIGVSVTAKDSAKIASSDSMTIQTATQEECYSASLSLDEESISVYYDASGTVPVVVENKGADRATYSLSVSGTASNFVYLNPSTIEVDPGKSEIVYLYIAPSSQVTNGNYEASISVRLDDSTILASDDVKITITDSPDDIPDYSPEESSGESFWSKIVAFFSGLFGGPEDVSEDEPLVDLEENISDDLTDEEEETPEEEVEEEEVIVVGTLMDLGESVDFQIGEEDHVMTIAERSGEVLLVELSSDTVYVQMYPGDVKSVDVNSDEVDDIEISFTGFVGDKADISYTLLEQPEVVEEEDTGLEDVTGDVVEGDSESNGFFDEFFNSLKSIFVGISGVIVGYWIQLLILGLVIVVIVTMNKTKVWEKMVKFFEEEIEEEQVLKVEESKEKSLKAEEVDDFVIESFDGEKPIKKSEKEEEKPKKEEKLKKEEKPKKEKKPSKKEEKSKAEEEDEFVIEFDDE